MKYRNLILMILFAGVIALVLFLTNQKGQKVRVGKKANSGNDLMETINIRLDGFEKKDY